MINKIITDEEIKTVWGRANFGSMTKRDVIKYGLLKCACGYIQGHTITIILEELHLINKNYKILKKGREYLWLAFSKGNY